MAAIIFLTLEHVLRVHERVVKLYGGSDGIRDVKLIESAIALPQQGFGGQYVHKSLAEMAAAYLFHLTKNHGFVDGNKRTGFVAALTFLEMNDIDTDGIDENEMEAITRAVADGTGEKQAVIDFFVSRVRSE
jgi:death-on-curing protein